MSRAAKPVTIIVPSYCPTVEVKGYEWKCLACLNSNTPRELYDLIVMQGGDWSYPQKVNSAMTGVRTEFAVVLSNDVFVGPEWLPRMLALYTDAQIADCGVLAPADDPAEKRIWWEESWWALVLFKTQTFRNIDGLDESLPYTYHDQDFSIRLRREGKTVMRTNQVVVEHVNMATRRHIKVDDEPERLEMIRRHGVSEYRDYLERLNANRLSE